MARNFTDAELQQVAEYVALRYLEVERGLRGKECLRHFLSPQAYNQQFDAAASRFSSGGMVRQTDLGRMSFQRLQPDRVHIAIPTRQQGDRWGALVMELRADNRSAWRVTELTRAQDRNLTRPRFMPEWKGPGDPDLALVELTKTAVAARTAKVAAAEEYATGRQDLARVAPEKPAGELVVGDFVNNGTLQTQRWTKVRSLAVDKVTGGVNLRVADGTRFRLPAERLVAAAEEWRGGLDKAERQPGLPPRHVDEGLRLARRVMIMAGHRQRIDEQVPADAREICGGYAVTASGGRLSSVVIPIHAGMMAFDGDPCPGRPASAVE